MTDMPILRLELEGMRHGLLRALGDHHDEMRKAVEEETARFVAEYDYRAAIRQVLPDLLNAIVRETLNREFGWEGNGRKLVLEMLRQAQEREGE